METHRERIENDQCTRCGVEHEPLWLKKKCKTCGERESAYRKKTRSKRRERERLYRIKHWAERCCYLSRGADIRKDRAITSEYITPKRLKTLRALQLNRCFYCRTPMYAENRKRRDGLTIERLDNRMAHNEGNIVLCCSSCNCRRLSNLQTTTLENAYRTILTRLENAPAWEHMIESLGSMSL
jgi:hypothetical protein